MKMDEIKAVCAYSGGLSSYLAAKRHIAQNGKEGVVLLFCDTGEEDLDLYRFAIQGSAKLGVSLASARREGGMDRLIDEHNAIPNNRMPFCSRELKVEVARAWIKEHAPGAILVYGIAWQEIHRVPKIQKNWPTNNVIALMTERPYLFHHEMEAEVLADGIDIPQLYKDGFKHNNCGGACVRAGHAAWVHTLQMRPAVFQKWVEREERISARHGKPCTILRDRRGGSTRPLPLSEFRKRFESGLFTPEELEGCHGGCGCFSDEEDGND